MRFIILFLSLIIIQFNCFAGVEDVFETIKKDPKKLYSFIKAMPKGGELHYHLAGGAYPEAMLASAAQNNFCIAPKTLSVTYQQGSCNNQDINISTISPKSNFYQQIIQAWSFKNFKAGKISGHDHFFNSFHKFIPIVVIQSAPLLARVIQRAADQHELYMEVMLSVKDFNKSIISKEPIIPSHFNRLKERLLTNQAFNSTVQEISTELTNLLPNARNYLGCDKKPEQAACQLKINFQLHVLREQPLDKIFSQALLYFTIAAKTPEVVAVNLVQAEDGPISLKDYHHQMQIFNFMHQLYPNVHIALHAGELSKNAKTSTLKTKDLRFHINEAIKLGHAERIGHGVAIKQEDNANKLIKYMAFHRIPVEINLTSNSKILNISKEQHPLPFYLKSQIPVVLSTDDEGILRTSLTQEYVIAIKDYHLDYQTLKRLNHNALTYSFLPGKSLWADPIKLIPISACRKLNSNSCLRFIKTSEKAKLQRKLELKLQAFEKLYRTFPLKIG
ncbi:adenosine deaminase [Legionella busanensis]|uniref:adenosine deaminase n=1 Tax=Legionella busanensis TaxID=190655 RepID=A0A378JGV7_9GAMM|nr:adenosine deaminase [Legionella busanensis]STX50536.1 adenosine deaminase [Legionella busanensis]